MCFSNAPKWLKIEWSIEGGLSAVRSGDQQKIEPRRPVMSPVDIWNLPLTTPRLARPTISIQAKSQFWILVLTGLTPPPKKR